MADGQPQHRAGRSPASALDDDEPIPSTLYGDFRPIDGLSIPHRRTLVRGLAEAPVLEVDNDEV